MVSWLSMNKGFSLSGTVKTTWKYFTGSKSASRAIVHFSLSMDPHLGQFLLRQLLFWCLIAPQSRQASTCPPMKGVRHFSNAWRAFSLCAGSLCLALRAGKKLLMTVANSCPGQLSIFGRIKHVQATKFFDGVKLRDVQVHQGCSYVPVPKGFFECHYVLSGLELVGGIRVP